MAQELPPEIKKRREALKASVTKYPQDTVYNYKYTEKRTYRLKLIKKYYELNKKLPRILHSKRLSLKLFGESSQEYVYIDNYGFKFRFDKKEIKEW